VEILHSMWTFSFCWHCTSN